MKQDDMVSAAYAQGRRDQRESDEALLRKALEAMEYSGMDVGKFNRINAACQALRAALAEPSVEPVKQCMAHGECFGGECIYQRPAEPVQEPAPMPPFPPVSLWKRGCAVCGIGAGGHAYGYACPRSDCPTRVTCGGTV